jgi:hypothetical protein
MKNERIIDFERYKYPAFKAACAFGAWEVQNWTLSNCIFFLGTLGFRDQDVDDYRRAFRNLSKNGFGDPDGKALLAMNTPQKLVDVYVGSERSEHASEASTNAKTESDRSGNKS